MDERITLKNMGEKLLKSEITPEEFGNFFETFKTNLENVKDEFKKTVEPSIYFNADSKKIAEKSAVFTSLFDELDRGIRILDNSLALPIDLDKFEKGYKTIMATSDKMEQFRSEVSVLANSTPM